MLRMAFNSRFKKCRAGFGLGFGCDFCMYAEFCSPIKVTIYLFMESILNTVCVNSHTVKVVCIY